MFGSLLDLECCEHTPSKGGQWSSKFSLPDKTKIHTQTAVHQVSGKVITWENSSFMLVTTQMKHIELDIQEIAFSKASLSINIAHHCPKEESQLKGILQSTVGLKWETAWSRLWEGIEKLITEWDTEIFGSALTNPGRITCRAKRVRLLNRYLEEDEVDQVDQDMRLFKPK